MSVDDEVEILAAERGQTYDEAFGDVWADARDTAEIKLMYAIDERRNIIWDQTNLSIFYRLKSIARFPPEYSRNGFVLLPPGGDESMVELRRRLNNRPGKTIPDSVLAGMIEGTHMPTITDGFHSLKFFDSFNNFRQIDDIDMIFYRYQYTKNYGTELKKQLEIDNA